MAVYKVPQDVEADDKLIGPFSFRQFIYIIIAVIGIALAWGLAQLFIGLAIIPLPIVIFFGALALPLRKDQPMEIYLAAVVSFYLKPRRRLWQPDGVQSLIEIIAPKTVEVRRTKDLSESGAEQRLSYLANIVDTGGWAVRGVSSGPESSMNNDAYFAAQQTEDVLDTSSSVAQSFNTMISQADARRHEAAIARMRQPAPAQPVIPPPPTTTIPSPQSPQNTVVTPEPAFQPPAQAPLTPGPEPQLTYNPYPNSMHQTVINPLGEASQATPEPPIPASPIPPPNPPVPTSEAPVSPDIIKLANNSDLSIETIAHEANRIHEKEEKLGEEEVVISLR